MTEEVRKDPGNRLGNYIKTDKRSWLSEQAKFMRVHADLPIEKPLHRGCHVVNPDGEKYWVTFKYERLPNFCFRCGILRHDEKHCPGFPHNSDSPKQYGDWLHANGNSKMGTEKSKTSNSRGLEERMGEGSDDKITSTTTTSLDLMTGQKEIPKTPKGHSKSKNTVSNGEGMSVMQITENQVRWDKPEASSSEQQKKAPSHDPMNTTPSGSKDGVAYSIVGLLNKLPHDAHEVISPLKPNKVPNSARGNP